MKKGRFVGVGVGCGDPELVTIKALKAIEAADVLMLPAKDREKCRAFRIISEAFRLMEKSEVLNDKPCLFEPFPMLSDEEALIRFHESVAETVAKKLAENLDVIFPTIGDPSIYATFDYVALILKEKGYETDRISGVSSVCESANRLGISLGQKEEEVHIIPGSADLTEALHLHGTKVFMKAGQQLADLKRELTRMEEAGECDVFAVTNCSLPEEDRANCAKDISDDWGYMTIIIVKEKK